MTSDSEVTEGVRGRYDELDGLRALSVLGIVAFHLFPVTGLWFTVNLFFVLSGFFITRNLLVRERSTVWRSVIGFYRGRMIRIAPLYYSYIALLALIYGVSAEPAVLPRYIGPLLTFTYNLTRTATGWLNCDYFTHLWSLSVEMQFYLIWPWVIILCPSRYVSALCGAILCLSPVWRYGLSERLLSSGVPLNNIADCVYWSTLGHLDAFAAGALVAIFGRASHGQSRFWQRVGFLLLMVVGIGNILYLGVPVGYHGVLVASLGYPIHNTDALQHVWAGSVLTICWGTLVWRLVGDTQGTWWLTRVLRASFLVDIGRVSYGIYVWHWLSLLLLGPLLPNEWIVSRAVMLLPLIWAVTYLVAKCSYRFIESPARRRLSRADTRLA